MLAPADLVILARLVRKSPHVIPILVLMVALAPLMVHQ